MVALILADLDARAAPWRSAGCARPSPCLLQGGWDQSPVQPRGQLEQPLRSVC